MPTICRFYGIIISMNYREEGHHVPHFHARYGSHKASVAIEGPSLLAGYLPPQAEKLVLEWTRLYQAELLENWSRAGRREALSPIPPLE